MKEICTIEDIAVMTGLSTRTIRTYIANGQLDGEKVDGAWQFTLEQFSAFLKEDMVRQSIQAKANGIVYDFLLMDRRREQSACLVWDWPVEGGEAEGVLREKLMEQVNAHGLRCSYRYENGTARAILSGAPEALAEVLTAMK